VQQDPIQTLCTWPSQVLVARCQVQAQLWLRNGHKPFAEVSTPRWSSGILQLSCHWLPASLSFLSFRTSCLDIYPTALSFPLDALPIGFRDGGHFQHLRAVAVRWALFDSFWQSLTFIHTVILLRVIYVCRWGLINLDSPATRAAFVDSLLIQPTAASLPSIHHAFVVSSTMAGSVAARAPCCG
jgi:hypothetical protein